MKFWNYANKCNSVQYIQTGFATVSPIQSNIGLAFDAVLQDDRLLAALHNEHHGLHFGLPHFPSGANYL